MVGWLIGWYVGRQYLVLQHACATTAAGKQTGSYRIGFQISEAANPCKCTSTSKADFAIPEAPSRQHATNADRLTPTTAWKTFDESLQRS